MARDTRHFSVDLESSAKFLFAPLAKHADIDSLTHQEKSAAIQQFFNRYILLTRVLYSMRNKSHLFDLKELFSPIITNIPTQFPQQFAAWVEDQEFTEIISTLDIALGYQDDIFRRCSKSDHKAFIRAVHTLFVANLKNTFNTSQPLTKTILYNSTSGSFDKNFFSDSVSCLGNLINRWNTPGDNEDRAYLIITSLLNYCDHDKEITYEQLLPIFKKIVRALFYFDTGLGVNHVQQFSVLNRKIEELKNHINECDARAIEKIHEVVRRNPLSEAVLQNVSHAGRIHVSSFMSDYIDYGDSKKAVLTKISTLAPIQAHIKQYKSGQSRADLMLRLISKEVIKEELFTEKSLLKLLKETIRRICYTNEFGESNNVLQLFVVFKKMLLEKQENGRLDTQRLCTTLLIILDKVSVTDSADIFGNFFSVTEDGVVEHDLPDEFDGEQDIWDPIRYMGNTPLPTDLFEILGPCGLAVPKANTFPRMTSASSRGDDAPIRAAVSVPNLGQRAVTTDAVIRIFVRSVAPEPNNSPAKGSWLQKFLNFVLTVIFLAPIVFLIGVTKGAFAVTLPWTLPACAGAAAGVSVVAAAALIYANKVIRDTIASFFKGIGNLFRCIFCLGRRRRKETQDLEAVIPAHEVAAPGGESSGRSSSVSSSREDLSDATTGSSFADIGEDEVMSARSDDLVVRRDTLEKLNRSLGGRRDSVIVSGSSGPSDSSQSSRASSGERLSAADAAEATHQEVMASAIKPPSRSASSSHLFKLAREPEQPIKRSVSCPSLQKMR